MKRFLAIGLLATTLTAIAVAQSPVGVWKGKVVFNWSKVPAKVSKDPKFADVKKATEAQLKNMLFKITVKKDGTYDSVATGLPGGQKDEKESGKWTAAGNKITFVDPKGTKQVITLAKDGKTATWNLPGGPGMPEGTMSMIFSKA